MTATSTDYVGNLILKNGHPEMLRLDDGYVSFDSDTISGIHYYIQDYMGNNRVVVNKDGTIEQITHYYPYGGVIGDISGNESLQKFKFEGKELDRTFGLDNYDIHARQYFAMAPMWDRPDPKAEDYYDISPYVYCGGDPVNLEDYNGMEVKVKNNYYLNRNYNYVVSNYLNKYKGLAKSMRTVIQSKDYTVNLVYTNEDTNYDYKSNTIYWNPYYAVKTDNGYCLTPMQALFHEFNHAKRKNENPKQFEADANNRKNTNYDNHEDERAITGEEQEDAKILAPILNNPVPEEGTRPNHSGISYQSKGCDSIEPTDLGKKKLNHELDEVTVTKKNNAL